jgi:hypothetical protein
MEEHPGGVDMTGHDEGRTIVEATQPSRGSLGVRLAVRGALPRRPPAAGGREEPHGHGREHERAPDFSLVGADREIVSLGSLLGSNDTVVIVFYRGFF